MRELSNNLFAAIVKGADEEIAFDRAIKEKMEKALEIHKVGLASSIFNEVPSTNKEAGQLKKDGYEVYESTELEEGLFGDIKKAFNSGKVEALYKGHEDAFIKMIEPHVESMQAEVFLKALKQGIKPERQLRLLDKEIQAAIAANGGLRNTIKKLGIKESTELEEAKNWWTVTITKKAGKLFKGQTVDVKATSLSDAIKKGLKQMKANPALVPSDAVDAELAESKFTEDLEEATLKKVEGSPANIQKHFKDLITNAKTIKDVTDDEYMRWYASMDEKIYMKWDKMVKAIPQYKKAYKLGVDGASGVSPFPKGTLASAIWSNEKAAGEMDS